MTTLKISRPGFLLVAIGVAACAPDGDEADANGTVAQADSIPVAAADTQSGASPGPAVGPDGERLLTPDGWGPLRIGMTRAEVEAAAGPDANPGLVGGPEPEACDEFRPEGAPAGMLLMVERDTLTRITVMRNAPVRTQAGLGVGDSAAAVVRAYGSAAEVTPHKYLAAPASYITVWESGPETVRPRGLVYVTGLGETVTHVHAGGPSIRYVEGCL